MVPVASRLAGALTGPIYEAVAKPENDCDPSYRSCHKKSTQLTPYFPAQHIEVERQRNSDRHQGNIHHAHGEFMDVGRVVSFSDDTMICAGPYDQRYGQQ